MEITVDASAIMAVILNEPSKAMLLERTRDADLVSAATLPWEVGNSLTALLKRARLDVSQAKRALRSFVGIPVRLMDVDLAASVELAGRYRIYAYDAYVLECARQSGTPLLSLDGSQCEVARRLGLEVLEA